MSMTVPVIRHLLESLPDSFKMQVTNGHTYKLRKHRLTGAVVKRNDCGRAVVLGIRVDAKKANVRHAFMLKSLSSGSKYLSSRASFKVLKDE